MLWDPLTVELKIYSEAHYAISIFNKTMLEENNLEE